MSNLLNHKTAKVALLVILGVTAFLGWKATKIKLSYDFEAFFPSKHEEVIFYQNFKKKFTSNDRITMLAFTRNQGIVNTEGLTALSAAVDSIKRLDHVQNVRSILDVQSAVVTQMGLINYPIVQLNESGDYSEDSIRIWHNPIVNGYLIDSAYQTALIQVTTSVELGKSTTDSLANHFNDIKEYYKFDNLNIGGRIINQAHILEKMTYEMALFVLISFLLVVIALWLVFKSFWAVVTPVSIVLLTATWTVGFMAIFEKPIDVLSSLIPSILFIVGVSDVIHIFSKYLDELRKGANKKRAIINAYKRVGLATFITSLTTSIGFSTLLLSTVKPIQEFGIFMAAGVLTAFFLSFTLYPALLILIPKPKAADNKRSKERWDQFLEKCHNLVFTNQSKVWIVTILLVGISVFAVANLKTNNYLTEELPRGDDLRNSFSFFEEYFGGARTFDAAVSLKDTNKSFYDFDILKQINSIDSFLVSYYGLKAVISPATLVKELNMASYGGLYQHRVFTSKQEYKKIRRNLKKLGKQKAIKELINEDENLARFRGNMKDEGGIIHLAKNDTLKEFVKAEAPDLQIHITGMPHLIDMNNVYLSRSLLRSLGAAFILIALLMAILYQSVRIIIIAIIPNILPLLFMAAIMYFNGIDLKVSTALIFTVVFGIAVDDTIHFLSYLKLELNKGLNLNQAILHTYKTTGKSIILTSVILFSGFVALGLSEFSSTRYMGILVSISLLMAVVIDLTILPILLKRFGRRSSKVLDEKK